MSKTRTLMALCAALSLLAILPASGQAKTTRRVCVVPKLAGNQLVTARKRLIAAHCAVGTVHNPKAAKGSTLIVSAENPKAGKREPSGKRVGLTFKLKAAKVTTPAPKPAPVVTTPPATVAAPTTTRASIDPSYTQNPANPLQVTWSYSASADGSNVPEGTLSLTVYQSAQVGAAGGCSMNVGDGVNGGNCTVTIPSYGTYQVTVAYEGSDPAVAPATSTDTETISDPYPAPAPTPPAGPQATTLTASIAYGTPTQNTGPPPTNLQSTNIQDAVSLASSDPDTSQTCTYTVADVTTGQAVTSSAISCSNPFDLALEQDVGSPTVNIYETSTFPGLSFNQGDTVTLTATSASTTGYTGATSSAVTVWPTP
jgi:hypothetical protein